MTHPDMQHLTTDEIELWAQGLLGAARAFHVADCSLCRAEAARERKVILELVALPRFAPGPGFAERVMARVKVPTASGDWTA